MKKLGLLLPMLFAFVASGNFNNHANTNSLEDDYFASCTVNVYYRGKLVHTAYGFAETDKASCLNAKVNALKWVAANKNKY